MAQRRQGTIWLLTIPHAGFTPYLPGLCSYIRGQLELGEGGFLHWQILVYFRSKQSIRGCRDLFGPYHCELSRSAAADAYVWKDDTAVANTRFELGSKPIRRNSAADWDQVLASAKSGRLDEIPADITVRYYSALRSIRSDYSEPLGIERTAVVYWGRTGTGKSRRAWEQAGVDAYPKDPRTKFWDGYRGQEHVVLDEFRGCIDVSHILRWLDRYPVRVEIKGSSVPLAARRFWITSNIHPAQWWPQLDSSTLDAFYRRVEIVFFE